MDKLAKVVKFLSKQSLETESTIVQSKSLELVTIVIVISVMIGGYTGEDLK